jgi:hypothetical protein
LGPAHSDEARCVLTTGECPTADGSCFARLRKRLAPPLVSGRGMISRAAVEPRPRPTEFEAIVDWFDHICCGLVLLEEDPREDVEASVGRLDAAVRAHLRDFEAGVGPSDATADSRRGLRQTLDADHARFFVSLEQLRWFYARVETEDHGGNRQALGQYGRVLTEALRRHLREEYEYLASATGSPHAARS